MFILIKTMFKFSNVEVYFLFLQPLVFVVMTYVQCSAPYHQWVQQPKMNDCLAPEDEGTMIFQNIRNHSPSDTVSHSSRPEFSATPLWDHQILHCRHLNQLVLLVTGCEKDSIHNTRCHSSHKSAVEDASLLGHESVSSDVWLLVNRKMLLSWYSPWSCPRRTVAFPNRHISSKRVITDEPKYTLTFTNNLHQYL